jgi:WD40 repeat protein
MKPASDLEANPPEHDPILQAPITRRTALLLPALLSAGGPRLRAPNRPQPSPPLPSPLDGLDPARIPLDEHCPWQPKELVAVLGTHRGRDWNDVQGLALGPDGRWLVSVTYQTVQLWDAATLQPRAVLLDQGNHGGRALFSPDGQLLAVGGFGEVRLWDVSGEPFPIRLVLRPGSDTPALAFSPDGTRLAATAGSVDEDGWVLLCNLVTDEVLRTGWLPGHQVYGLTFAPDGRTLITVHAVRRYRDDDRGPLPWLLVSWQPDRHDPVAQVPFWPENYRVLSFSPDGRTLAIGGHDRCVRLWDVPTGVRRAILRGHRDWITSLAFSPDGRMLASGGSDHAVRLWDLETTGSGPACCLPGYESSVTGLAFSGDGRTLASAGGRAVRLWDLSGDRPRPVVRTALDEHLAWAHVAAFSPDGRTLASGGGDRCVRLWEVADGKLAARATFPAHEGWVMALAFSPDGRMLASGGGDRVACLWDLCGEQPRKRAVLSGHQDSVRGLAFSPSGRLLASTGCLLDNTLRLWDLRGEQPVERAVLKGCGGIPYGSVVFSPDGRRLAVASDQGRIGLWDLRGARPRPWLTLEHSVSVDALALSPDGRTLASVSGFEGTVLLWDLGQQSVRLRATLHWHPEHTYAFCLAFSPDGRTLLSGDCAGRIILWGIDGSKLREWKLPGSVYRAVFAPDGRHLATVNRNGTLYILRLTP